MYKRQAPEDISSGAVLQVSKKILHSGGENATMKTSLENDLETCRNYMGMRVLEWGKYCRRLEF